MAEFAHGVAQTVNLDLLLSAHSEGQHLLQELKAKRDVVNKLNGVDMKFYLPYSKVRIKLNKTAPSVMAHLPFILKLPHAIYFIP